LSIEDNDSQIIIVTDTPETMWSTNSYTINSSTANTITLDTGGIWESNTWSSTYDAKIKLLEDRIESLENFIKNNAVKLDNRDKAYISLKYSSEVGNGTDSER
jgi:hypothetical protein